MQEKSSNFHYNSTMGGNKDHFWIAGSFELLVDLAVEDVQGTEPYGLHEQILDSDYTSPNRQKSPSRSHEPHK